MYSFDQDIANDIAKGPMKYWLMKVLFEATEEEAEKIEDFVWEDIGSRYSRNVARATMTSLPLLLEHKAITKYISKTKQFGLRSVLPEMLTAEEGAYLAHGDIRRKKKFN